jgi:hypothetical protein
MRSSVVAKRDFGRAKSFERLDAEFMDSELLVFERDLRATPGRLLGDEVDRLREGHGRSLDSEAEVSYIAIDSIDNEDGLVFQDALKFGELPSRAKYQVKTNDILVSNVRPNRGAVGLLGSRDSGCLASSGFTPIRVKPASVLSPEYLFAYLKTDFGRSQLVRRARGSMYPAVVADDVFALWIPVPNKALDKEVRTVIDEARRAQVKFFDGHRSCTEMLNAYLLPYGAPPSPLEGDGRPVDWTVVKSSAVLGFDGAARLDAEFSRQCYVDFDARCQSLGDSFLLGKYFDLSAGNLLRPGSDVVPYAKQAVLTNVGVNWSALTWEQGTAPPEADGIRSGDILLACTAHEIAYVGRKVDFVRELPRDIKKPIGCVPDVMILRPKTNKPKWLAGSYVASVLRHPVGLYQVQRCIRGLRGGHVYRGDLAKYVRLPTPEAKWIEGYEMHAVAAEEARNEAKRQMTRAFEIVDAFAAALIGRRAPAAGYAE